MATIKAINERNDQRFEIREQYTMNDPKSGHNTFANVLIVVRSDSVVVSMNGKAGLTYAQWQDLVDSVRECQVLLR